MLREVGLPTLLNLPVEAILLTDMHDLAPATSQVPSPFTISHTAFISVILKEFQCSNILSCLWTEAHIVFCQEGLCIFLIPCPCAFNSYSSCWA